MVRHLKIDLNADESNNADDILEQIRISLRGVMQCEFTSLLHY